MERAASSGASGLLSHLGLVAVAVLNAGESVDLQPLGQIEVGADAAPTMLLIGCQAAAGKSPLHQGFLTEA